jgi:uncharacterized membrane protein
MNLQILIGLILTILPVSELRGGLPVIVEYVVRKNLSVWPYFVLVLILNILIIFFIFFFLDFLHNSFMRIGFYNRFMKRYLAKVRIKSMKVEKRMKNIGYFALALFVAIPLPGTGAWTGTIITWLLGLNRVKSFIAISLGVIIAGFIILGMSLGFFNGFF